MKKGNFRFPWKQTVALLLFFVTSFTVAAYSLGYFALPWSKPDVEITIAPLFPSGRPSVSETDGDSTEEAPITDPDAPIVTPGDAEYVTNLNSAFNTSLIEGYLSDRTAVSVDQRVELYNKLAGGIESLAEVTLVGYESYTADGYRLVRGVRLNGGFTEGVQTVVHYTKLPNDSDGSYRTLATEYTVDRKRVQPYMGYLLISRVERREVIVTAKPPVTTEAPVVSSEATSSVTPITSSVTTTTAKPATTPAPVTTTTAKPVTTTAAKPVTTTTAKPVTTTTATPVTTTAAKPVTTVAATPVTTTAATPVTTPAPVTTTTATPTTLPEPTTTPEPTTVPTPAVSDLPVSGDLPESSEVPETSNAPETSGEAPVTINTPVTEETPAVESDAQTPVEPSAPSAAAVLPETSAEETKPQTVIKDVTVLSLCDAKGNVLVDDIGSKLPYYARDNKNRPVFEDGDGKLYAFDGSKFVEIEAIDLRVWLSYDYPAYPLGVYRDYEAVYDPETGIYTYVDCESGSTKITTDYFKAFNFTENGFAVTVSSIGNNLYVVNRSRRIQFKNDSRYKFPTGTAGQSLTAKNYFRLPDTLGIESIGSAGYDHGWLRIRIQALSQMSNSFGTVIDDWETLVDEKGNYFDLPEGYTLEGYSDGVLLLSRDGLYGYYGLDGNWITQPIFPYARPFIQGLAVVGNEDGTVGMIDTSGNIVLPFVYTSLSDVSSGVITAYCEGIGWETYYLIEK